ncbi:hypothetical protein HMPREF0653_02850 [Prevotella disiens JCM 6334 = ATCC 29426]|uniref:Uncharacterized protein n=1 Tax=Prevotella disiens JCM 6334 = ATCC 29426 TaxID=1235811 RepID=A0ABP2Y7D2_9BACT|nr:hypothetical protein HMPREF0653_02850 [Prevotella disiens JCM 6334 = ATCC 29426]
MVISHFEIATFSIFHYERCTFASFSNAPRYAMTRRRMLFPFYPQR